MISLIMMTKIFRIILAAWLAFNPAIALSHETHPMLELARSVAEAGHEHVEGSRKMIEDTYREFNLERQNAVYVVDFAILSFMFPPKASGRTVGLCMYGTKTILLDSKNWKRFSQKKNKLIILHELTHCLVGMKHVEVKMLDDGCVADPMQSVAPSEKCVEKHYDRYIKQFRKYLSPQ